jgi:hypothetical protein
MNDERERIVAAWTEADTRRALHAADRRATAHSAAIRALIVELALTESIGDKLFDACAALGRLIAEHLGSPTLASATLDQGAQLIGASRAEWVVPARAAVFEGYAAFATEQARREGLAAWEYPRCVVRLSAEQVAISAACPTDDQEELRDWAGRTASLALLHGVRGAIVSGPDRARTTLLDALDLAGIDGVSEDGTPSAITSTR